MRTTRVTLLSLSLCLLFGVLVSGAPRSLFSVCDYDPPESRLLDLLLQGTFQWYNGPRVEGEDLSLSGALVAELDALFSSSAYAQRVEARGEARGTHASWNASLAGRGSLTSYVRDDLFGIAAIGLTADLQRGLEMDLTGGVGTGRFRDVTPMARAIRLQNALLDIGQLVAPMTRDALMEIAQILGQVGLSVEEMLSEIAEGLRATGLLAQEELSIRGWLAVESALSYAEPTRLCGSDVQIRVGATAALMPDVTVSATGMVFARYAAAPDPVSQWAGDVEARFRLAKPKEMSVRADLSYVRRLPDGWTARGSYRVEFDHLWRQPDASWIRHEASVRMTTSILGGVGLSIVCDAQHQTGDERPTVLVALQLEASLF